MHNAPMYKILWSRGQGTCEGPRFRRFHDALRYVNERRSECSFAILNPNGGVDHIARRNMGLARERVSGRRLVRG